MLLPTAPRSTAAYNPLPCDGIESEIPGKLRGRDWRNHYLKHPLGASNQGLPVRVVAYRDSL
jgi:hypothetical protein